MVPVDQLDDDPLNPRTECPREWLDDLAKDIAERGVLQPIVTAPPDMRGRYRIQFGALRWRAAQLAGLPRFRSPFASSHARPTTRWPRT